MIFYNALQDQAIVLKEILQKYELAFGQTVNYAKIDVVLANVSQLNEGIILPSVWTLERPCPMTNIWVPPP